MANVRGFRGWALHLWLSLLERIRKLTASQDPRSSWPTRRESTSYTDLTKERTLREKKDKINCKSFRV
jgi:hypothetical protein